MNHNGRTGLRRRLAPSAAIGSRCSRLRVSGVATRERTGRPKPARCGDRRKPVRGFDVAATWEDRRLRRDDCKDVEIRQHPAFEVRGSQDEEADGRRKFILRHVSFQHWEIGLDHDGEVESGLHIGDTSSVGAEGNSAVRTR